MTLTSKNPGKARLQRHSDQTQSVWSSRGDQATLYPLCKTTAVHSRGRIYLYKWGTLRMVSQLIFRRKDLNMGFFCINFFSLLLFPDGCYGSVHFTGALQDCK